MTKRENEFGIKTLIMCPFFTIVHPTTQAKLQLKTIVEFFPGQHLPEFTEVQNTIRQRIDNQKMPVEEAVDSLSAIFNEYSPKALKVRADIINNTAFFPVAVITENEPEIQSSAKSFEVPAEEPEEITTDEKQEEVEGNEPGEEQEEQATGSNY